MRGISPRPRVAKEPADTPRPTVAKGASRHSPTDGHQRSLQTLPDRRSPKEPADTPRPRVAKGASRHTPTEGDHKGLHPTSQPPPPLLGLHAPAERSRGPGKGGGGGDAGRRPLWSPSVGVHIRSLSPKSVSERGPRIALGRGPHPLALTKKCRGETPSPALTMTTIPLIPNGAIDGGRMGKH